MKSRLHLAVLLIASASVTCLTAPAQRSATAPAAMAASDVVPSLINYTGVLKDASGRTLASVTGVTFLLYSAEQGELRSGSKPRTSLPTSPDTTQCNWEPLAPRAFLLICS